MATKLNQRGRIIQLEISNAIHKAIHEICERENYDITYVEINAGILDALKHFNEQELSELWTEGEEENQDGETGSDYSEMDGAPRD